MGVVFPGRLVRDPQEARALLVGLGPNPLDLFELLAVEKPSISLPPLHDGFSFLYAQASDATDAVKSERTR